MTEQEREAETLRLYRECVQKDEVIAALTVQRDRLLNERDDALGDADALRADLRRERFEANGAAVCLRAELVDALAERDTAVAAAVARGEELTALRASLPAVHERAEFLQAEVNRLDVEVKDLLQGNREHRAETVSAESEADRLRAELARERAAAFAVGFVPVSELDVVFSEGAAMGAEAVALDVSQYLAALSEVDRRRGCDRCAAALMAVATDLPGVLGVMRAARGPVRRRSVKV